MEKRSTLVLRGAVLLIGLVVLAVCLFVLPFGILAEDVGGYRYILLGIYATTVPFYLAIHQAMNLLHYVDTNKAFSDLSVQALGKIGNCALVISLMYAAAMPYIYIVADRDDAPGVIVIGLVFMFASFVIATMTAALQRVLREAINIKTENDLTI